MNMSFSHYPGEVVTITHGAFKGELGRVVSAPPLQRVVTIHFLESSISVPLTLSIDHVIREPNSNTYAYA